MTWQQLRGQGVKKGHSGGRLELEPQVAVTDDLGELGVGRDDPRLFREPGLEDIEAEDRVEVGDVGLDHQNKVGMPEFFWSLRYAAGAEGFLQGLFEERLPETAARIQIGGLERFAHELCEDIMVLVGAAG